MLSNPKPSHKTIKTEIKRRFNFIRALHAQVTRNPDYSFLKATYKEKGLKSFYRSRE